jgi:hypothetical protein
MNIPISSKNPPHFLGLFPVSIDLPHILGAGRYSPGARLLSVTFHIVEPIHGIKAPGRCILPDHHVR